MKLSSISSPSKYYNLRFFWPLKLVWVDNSSVKLKEASGDTMTVKMNDGHFYYGDASELTFSFSNPNGNLALDTRSEASETWYNLYASPDRSPPFVHQGSYMHRL